MVGGAKTRDLNGCHAHFLASYSATCNCARASECDVVLERYVPYTNLNS